MIRTAVLADSLLQLRTLESLTSARNYNRWLADLVRPYLGDDPIEIGSGLGETAAIWLETGAPRITLSELEPAGAATLRTRFAGDGRVDVVTLDITQRLEGARRHTAAVAMNVLEHIEDDAGALSTLGQIVRPGGAVVLFVPAHQWAMSAFDRAIGHWRRYTRRSLHAVAERAGLVPERISYVNAPGLLAWLVGVKLLRRVPSDSWAVGVYDRVLVPIARGLETRTAPPFGQSVLAVCRVPR